MFKAINSHKEPVAFCLFYAFSFILMGEAVKSVNPVTSTFITYGLTAVFFAIVNAKDVRQILAACRKDVSTLLYLNLSTLANTLLAFVVMTYVSPLVYVIVFFGTLPFMNALAKWTASLDARRRGPIYFAVFVSAIVVGMLVSDTSLTRSAAGIGITLVSSAFAALYMSKSEVFHKNTKITASQLLSIRFFFVIVVCGGYSLFDVRNLQLTGGDVFLLVSTAITGSIIPLFLMQMSIARLGATTTSRFMPSIPIMCMLCLFVLGLQDFTLVQLLSILVFSALLFLQNLKQTNKPSRNPIRSMK